DAFGAGEREAGAVELELSARSEPADDRPLAVGDPDPLLAPDGSGASGTESGRNRPAQLELAVEQSDAHASFAEQDPGFVGPRPRREIDDRARQTRLRNRADERNRRQTEDLPAPRAGEQARARLRDAGEVERLEEDLGP